VRGAYSSGTPAIGVGAGNVPVIIDSSADLDDAAEKICASKIFDNATSCSSENSVTIVEAVYEDAIAALERAGGYRATPEECARIRDTLWQDGKLNRHIIARDPEVFAELCELPPAARSAKFFMVEDEGVGPEHPFSGEKLSVVLTVYRTDDFDHALDTVESILGYMGEGHSAGIHSHDDERIEALADRARVSTVLVNQPHAFNNGGSFDNGLAFTLSMGAGTWGDNDSCENLTYKHFLNYTYLARPIPSTEPTEDELYGDFLARHG